MASKSGSAALRSKLAESLDAANQDAPAEKEASIMTVPAASPAAEATASQPVLSDERLITSSMLLAAGAGAIPVPLWDGAAIVAVQVKMLSDLSAHYGTPFTRNAGKSVVLALLGGLAPGLLARGAAGMVVKAVPVLGTAYGVLAQPLFAAAVTYAIGRVFSSHLKSGGTLLTFDAKDFRDSVTNEVQTGLKKAVALKL
jgi:uncharacterized protein (DUF697 family)